MSDPTETWPDTSIKPNDLGEAPASANLKVWIDGYGVMITVRGNESSDIVTKIAFLVKYAKEQGWKNTWDEKPTGIQREKVDQSTCPHTNPGEKVSAGVRKPENKGRTYKYCLDCNAFQGWK